MKTAILSAAIFGMAIIAIPVKVQKRDSDTQNDLLDGVCKTVTVIFARGTLESGNVGSLAGPPFFDALDTDLGTSNVALQGVDYAASIEGYLEGGDPAGAANLSSLANLASTQCPSTQIVLSGYSQGAQVVHLGAAELSSAVAAKVAAVVLFGDPDNGKAFSNIDASKVDTFCATGDLICDDLPIVDPAHLAYADDAGAAATFVQQHVTI